ncbi:MAG TPA: PEP-CTERM sorting domain-containing protein [Longimicrobiales bacterium]|nr:PEP-CTERM sorting domain-containing protein [Longimicrobiales bacterium]
MDYCIDISAFDFAFQVDPAFPDWIDYFIEAQYTGFGSALANGGRFTVEAQFAYQTRTGTYDLSWPGRPTFFEVGQVVTGTEGSNGPLQSEPVTPDRWSFIFIDEDRDVFDWCSTREWFRGEPEPAAQLCYRVPEPGPLILLATGLFGVALVSGREAMERRR